MLKKTAVQPTKRKAAKKPAAKKIARRKGPPPRMTVEYAEKRAIGRADAPMFDSAAILKNLR